VVGLGCAGVLALVYFRLIVPFNQLRKSLRRLAGRDFRPVLSESRSGVFRETAGYVRRISELLQQLDQQITDEGFSLRAILSSMVEGVLITDRSQRIRLVNDPLQRLFDLPAAPINRTIMEVFCNHHLHHALEKTLLDGSTRRLEITVQMRTPDGYVTRHLEVYAGGINPGPKKRALGAVVVFNDITSLKNLEAVRRDFVANVSHEFRTPLAIINGYVETLLDGALDDRAMAEKSLRVMARNGERLTLLIEDLLTISRMEHRSSEMRFESVNLREIFERVCHSLEPAITERQAELLFDWPAEATRAEVDPSRIEQVFFNLLENALRHGPAEGVQVRVTARRDDGHLEVCVADNGPGIPAEDQPHIFERFYRVHKDRSRNAGGTGLGLSIVKHIVHAHEGTVTLQSAPGEGATFVVRLPVSQPPASAR
jgi:two-component system, OmpR family, phosphate regulon sensor histidine kinase PhoR